MVIRSKVRRVWKRYNRKRACAGVMHEARIGACVTTGAHKRPRSFPTADNSPRHFTWDGAQELPKFLGEEAGFGGASFFLHALDASACLAVGDEYNIGA